ncbi:MAG: HD-GYP domain-containing protein, partial [Treponema sp.]|nr:HD-GYP domain-containing protein [Treponema sp.]
IRILLRNKKVQSYVQISTLEPSNIDNRLFLGIKRNAVWNISKTEKGSIYEGFFTNTTKKNFSEWSALIELPKHVEVISTWNIKYNPTENLLILDGDKIRGNVIKPGGRIAFGFVVNSSKDFIIEKVSIHGKVLENPFSNPLFVLLLIFIFMILVVILTYSITRKLADKKIKALRIKEEELKKQKERDAQLIEQTMKTFVQFIDAKDEYTRGHSARVAAYSRAITKELGYDEKFQTDMYYMGLMHDIGKLTIPDQILNKTSRLSASEWEIIQLHTTNGADLLKNFTIMPELKNAVLYHHERYDGKGYINQLKGDDIPLCARIICVADSYDAMNTNRCYRLKFSPERIILELERCAGKQFDPKIVPAMVKLIKNGVISTIENSLLLSSDDDLTNVVNI